MAKPSNTSVLKRRILEACPAGYKITKKRVTERGRLQGIVTFTQATLHNAEGETHLLRNGPDFEGALKNMAFALCLSTKV
jgi:hypothetical protein